METQKQTTELAGNHKPKPVEIPKTLNISQLALLTGYTTKTIRDRLQKASCQSVGMDHNGGVLYEVKSALKAIYALESFKNKESKEDLKRYLQELKAQELEYKLQVQKGRLVPVSEIEPTIRQLFLFIKQTIDSFPSLVVHSLKSELPPELLPKVNSIMEEQTKKINEELSKPLFQVETGNDDE